MADYDFDLFTIGAGSGGVAGSRRAASHGARVAIAESVRVGGTCVLRGCVPKKLLIYGVHFREDIADAAGYGWTIEGARLDWAKLVAAKNRELDRLNGIYIKMLTDSKVAILDGRARLRRPHEVELGGRIYTARHILIATGGHPERVPVPGAELAITSDEALDLPRLPARMVIHGAGYIAIEFAGIFNAAGVEVTVVLRGDEILRGFDDDIRIQLRAEMEKKGIRFRTRTRITGIARQGDGYRVSIDSGEAIDTGLVMFATGRRPNTEGLGLEEAGVRLNERGAVAVDEWQRTSAPEVYAIGDCTDRLNLTPVAIAEGRALAETLFNRNPMRVEHDNVPTAVFSQPPIGTVGLSEAAARAQGQAVDVYMTRFRPMKHTLSGRDERVMIKLVVDHGSDRVLGCHMIGADAPEIVQAVAIAVKAGLTKRQFDATIAVHPTTAEEIVLMREKRQEPSAAA